MNASILHTLLTGIDVYRPKNASSLTLQELMTRPYLNFRNNLKSLEIIRNKTTVFKNLPFVRNTLNFTFTLVKEKYIKAYLLAIESNTYLLKPWCRIFFEKLIVTQLVKQ
jgi:hypothetical protein